MLKEKLQLWLPTRPYTLVDAVNRMAAATGSPGYAVAASGADYNGHHVSVFWNSYRGYWISEYFWAGRVVLARGTLAQCLVAAREEYNRGAKGATVLVHVDSELTDTMTTLGDKPEPTVSEKDLRLAEDLGYLPYSKEADEAHLASFRDARFEHVGMALTWERKMGVPAVGLLVNSATAEEYKIKLQAALMMERRVWLKMNSESKRGDLPLK